MCDKLSCRQDVKLGADRVHRGLDDGTNGWNCEHPIYELVEVRLDGGKCLNDSFAGIWRQLVEQASQLGIKVGDVDIGDLSTAAVNDLYTSLSRHTDEVVPALPFTVAERLLTSCHKLRTSLSW